MSLPSLIADFLGFIRHEKKWWMIPLVLMLIVLGLLSVFVINSPVAPFIYTFF